MLCACPDDDDDNDDVARAVFEEEEPEKEETACSSGRTERRARPWCCEGATTRAEEDCDVYMDGCVKSAKQNRHT